ncbi:MAG: zinc ribbon domain-containing protein [Lentisphaeria bacterium]|nr:zinc ribbon domain-containing protein [Lentisphaeria bacterium]
MPLFEYTCESCGHLFEKLVRNDGDIPSTCPACGEKTLRKVFSTFSPAVASSGGGGPCAAQGGCPVSGACGGGHCPF